MKQKILDTMARLDYAEEKIQIKRIKNLINHTDYPADSSRKETHLNTLKLYKERLEYAKRRIPMRIVWRGNFVYKKALCPTCGFELCFLRGYCSECGQRIVW